MTSTATATVCLIDVNAGLSSHREEVVTPIREHGTKTLVAYVPKGRSHVARTWVQTSRIRVRA
jgi:hypothetical protein